MLPLNNKSAKFKGCGQMIKENAILLKLTDYLLLFPIPNHSLQSIWHYCFLIYTFYIIRKFDLSYIYPIITGITQVLVILAGVFLLKEHISVPGIIGIILIIVGVFCLNIK